jgi:hypothetical protein
MSGGLYVETTADLGAGRNEVPALQHHHPDLLLCRQIVRPSVQTPQIGQ